MRTYKPSERMVEATKTRALLNGESKSRGMSYKIPQFTARIYKAHGIDSSGCIVAVVVLKGHGTRDERYPEYYAIQYREVHGEVDQDSKTVRQYSGRDARQKMKSQMRDVFALLDESIARFREDNGI